MSPRLLPFRMMNAAHSPPAGRLLFRLHRAAAIAGAGLVLATVTAQASLEDYDAAVALDAAGGLTPSAVLSSGITFQGNQNAPFDFGTVAGDGTFECIVQSSGPVDSGYLAVGANTQSNLRLQQYRNTGELGMTLLGVADYRFLPAVHAPAEPSHLVWSWDGSGTMRMFVNGTLAGTASGISTGFSLPAGAGWLGANPVGAEGMRGTVFRVTTYDTRLSEEVIRRHADAFTGVENPPVISRFSADPPIATMGAEIAFSWEVSGAESLRLDATDVTGLNGTTLTVTTGGAHVLLAVNRHGTTSRSLTVPVLQAAGHVVINEFMASNQSTLRDEFGVYSDWLELHNPTGAAVDLSGYSLTDNPANLGQWPLPGIILPAGGYLVIFLSGRDLAPAGGPWHANFRLGKDGEYLALSRAGEVVHEFAPAFPPQEDDVSWALTGADVNSGGFAARPTPGTANDAALPRPAPVRFSHPGGLLREPVQVELSCASPGARIRYQINGGPEADYLEPLRISGSSEVRARADLAAQSGPGTTAAWVRLAPDLAAYSSSLPLLMIDNFSRGSVPQKGWSGNGSGVRQVARQPAAWLAWERSGDAASTLGDPAFYSRIGIRGRGAYSSTWRQKPYSVEAWDESGAEQAVGVLDMPAHSDWVLYYPDPDVDKDPTLLFNTFVYDLARRLGHSAPRFRWVELFVNEDGGNLSLTDRRGVYAVLEKVSRGKDRLDFARLSDNGEEGGWLLSLNRMDAIPETGWPALNGATTPQFFRTAGANRIKQTQANNPAGGGDDEPQQSNGFLNFDNPGGYRILPAQRAAIEDWFRRFEDVLYGGMWRDPASGYRQWLDPDDFAGYFVFNELTKNGDGMLISMYPWKGDDGRLRMGPVWDYNYGSYYAGGGPTGSLRWRGDRLWYRRLFSDPDFLQIYTDRWFAWRQGAMSNAGIARVIDEQAAEISAARAVAQGISSAAVWSSRLTQMKSWLTQRAGWVDSQYAGMPVISPPGGIVIGGQEVSLTAPGGTVWHTGDGSDPRGPGGAVSPGAVSTASVTISQDTSLTARARISTNRWSAPVRTVLVTDAVPATAGNLTISEIHYHPAEPDAAELAAGFSDAEDFEFIELLNTGPEKISLEGLYFSKSADGAGIGFAFNEGTRWSLEPGARLLLVRHAEAFARRYGDGLPVAGEFQGHLGNGGDTLTLFTGTGSPLLRVAWTDQPPWPAAADGQGNSLTLLPGMGPAAVESAAGWRSSVAVGGSPGTSDSLPLTDGDLAAYAFGFAGSAVAVENGAVTVIQPRRAGSDQVAVILEYSPDLAGWSESGPEDIASEPDPDGVIRLRRTLPAGQRGYVRWRLRSRF